MKQGSSHGRGGTSAAEAQTPRTSPTPAERSAGATDGGADFLKADDQADEAALAEGVLAEGRKLVEAAFKSGTLKTPSQWDREPDKPKVAIWEGLIKKNTPAAFVAPAKLGKSNLVEALGLHLASRTHKRYLDRLCSSEKVYFAFAENDEQENKDRWRRIMEASGITPDDIEGNAYFDNLSSGSTTFGEIRAKCLALGVTVAIVDPFYFVAKIPERDEQACLDVIEEMRKFDRDGITLIVVLHSPKGFSGDREVRDQIAGSSFLARYFASIIVLMNHATESKARVVGCALRSFKEPNPFVVTMENGIFELAPNVAPEVATAANAYKRNAAQEKTDAADILPYAIEAIRAAAKVEGRDFVGMTQGALAEKVRISMQTDGKHAPGGNRTKALLDLLPRDKVTCKKIGRGVYYSLAEGVRNA